MTDPEIYNKLVLVFTDLNKLLADINTRGAQPITRPTYAGNYCACTKDDRICAHHADVQTHLLDAKQKIERALRAINAEG